MSDKFDDIDDLDDLDDYLDEFDEEILSQEPGATLEQHEPELAANVDEFMKELEPEAEFGDTINDTIKRLKDSNKNIDAEAASGNENEELLTTLLNSLDLGDTEGLDELKGLLNGEGAAEGAENGDDIDNLSNVLMNMLNKLTTKDMMYETICSAVVNYNEYFKENKPVKGNKDDDRYVNQLRYLKNVKEKFDSADYDPENDAIRDYIDEQMEEFNKLLPAPEGVVQDNLGGLGVGNVDWNDNEVPKDLETCVQQ